VLFFIMWSEFLFLSGKIKSDLQKSTVNDGLMRRHGAGVAITSGNMDVIRVVFGVSNVA
jgi:hypothetical protein